MISRDSDIKELVKECIGQLYEDKEIDIFERNKGKGLSERCIAFRFAYHLQNMIKDAFIVDCDFNSSFEEIIGPDLEKYFEEIRGKGVPNPDGTITKRFIDIIVHKRDTILQNNLICIEIKKWNNYSKSQRKKDRNNLTLLTYENGPYGYFYGFHISLHRVKTSTVWTIFQNGGPIEGQEDVRVFENEAAN